MSVFEEGALGGEQNLDQNIADEGGSTPASTPNPLEPGGVRFEQVYGKMKEYETKYKQLSELGDPNSVRERLTKLEQYEQALAEYRKKQAQTPSEQAEAQRAQQIRSELLKVYPELKDVETLKELRDAINEIKQQTTQRSLESTLEKASQKFTDVLKASKIDTKYQSKIEEYLVSQMSQEQMREFANGNFEVAEQIFNQELKDGLFAGMRSRTLPPAPLVRNTPGGTPPSSKSTKITSLEEAATVGFGMLQNRE